MGNFNEGLACECLDDQMDGENWDQQQAVVPYGIGVCYVPDDVAIPLIEKMCGSGLGLNISDLPNGVRQMIGNPSIQKPNHRTRSVKELSRSIRRVIFNEPYTIILWADGSKTTVKCQDCDSYNKEHGFAMALLKSLLGNNGQFNELFHAWCEEKQKD